MESVTAKDMCQDADMIDVSECSTFHTAMEASPSPALHPQHASSTPTSTSQYFSAHIDAMMRNRSKFPDQVEFDIESSKVLWNTMERPARRRSTVDMEKSEGSSSGDEEEEDERELDKEVLKANRAAMQDQKQHPVWGRVFREEDDKVYEIGEKIAQGGQAKIYAGIRTDIPEGRRGRHVVFKVFEKGTCLEDLIKQWPEGAFRNRKMLQTMNLEGELEKQALGKYAALREFIYEHEIEHVMILPEDGRIAMVMERAMMADLQWLIDLKKQAKDNQGPPFDLDTTWMLMREIAFQMKGLHSLDVVHKDLKASNVLIGRCVGGFNPGDTFVDIQLNVANKFIPWIADYECANGVMGIGFWRAPKLLSAIKDRTYSPLVITKKSDVYRYGMLRYEIATGFLSFEQEGFETCRADIDCVINGQRPTFLDNVDWMVKELIASCWHKDENQRPTFAEIFNRFWITPKGRWELKVKFDPLLLRSKVLTAKR